MGQRGIFGEYSCKESREPLELPSTVSGFLSFGLNQHFFFNFILLSCNQNYLKEKLCISLITNNLFIYKTIPKSNRIDCSFLTLHEYMFPFPN